MERLIDDLLSYSGLGRKEIRKREVNLSHLLKESVSQILTQTEGRDIVWKIDKLPNVYGEPSMLKLVLINLIANAVKFTSTRTKAEIEIGCRKTETKISVSLKTMALDLTWTMPTSSSEYFNVFILTKNLKAQE